MIYDSDTLTNFELTIRDELQTLIDFLVSHPGICEQFDNATGDVHSTSIYEAVQGRR